MTKLNKLVELQGTEWKLEHEEYLQRTGKLIGRRYSCPVQFISFRSKKVKRQYTDEQRKAMRERMSKIHSASSI